MVGEPTMMQVYSLNFGGTMPLSSFEGWAEGDTVVAPPLRVHVTFVQPKGVAGHPPCSAA